MIQRKNIGRMLITLVLAYVAIVLYVMAVQRRLIYFPARLTPSQAEQAAASAGFSPWQDNSGQVIGWRLPAANTSTGSVLVVHGNAGCALDREYLARPFQAAAALDVYLLEYPGYGARSGSPSLPSLLAAAEEAFSLLDKTKPVYVVSESLGTGVATYLAHKHPEDVAGLLLFTPYNDLAQVAQRQLPFVPVYLLLRDRFRPAVWLGNYHGPVKFVLAGADEVIPPKFGQRLYEQYAGPKEIQIIPHAAHNEVFDQELEWWQEVLSFWYKHPIGSDVPFSTPE